MKTRIVLALFAALFSGNLFAQNGTLQTQAKPARPLDIATDPFTQLNLTAVQKQEVTRLQKAHQEEVKPLNDKVLKLRQDLGAEMQKPTPDNAKADAIMAETQQVMTQVAQKRDALRLDVRKQLTLEQQTVFDRLVPPAVANAQPIAR
ncbi:MAG: periplasmic heavy metal sensor [Bacteroidetes bacterium]|nr:periplasmic heavy metal sensor [Bacteroidota bacterium]